MVRYLVTNVLLNLVHLAKMKIVLNPLGLNQWRLLGLIHVEMVLGFMEILGCTTQWSGEIWKMTSVGARRRQLCLSFQPGLQAWKRQLVNKMYKMYYAYPRR